MIGHPGSELPEGSEVWPTQEGGNKVEFPWEEQKLNKVVEPKGQTA